MKGFIVSALMILPSLAIAQHQITVKVVDSQTKKPVKEALVKVKGTTKETATNVLGFFQVTADVSDTLLISAGEYEAGVVNVPEGLTAFMISLTPLPPIELTGLDSVAAETPASFQGGMESMAQFIGKHLHYPSDAKRNRVSGRVFLLLIIEKDGSVSDVSIKKGVHPSLNEEAMRVMRQSPPWNPATRNGVPVKSEFVLPIVFTLN